MSYPQPIKILSIFLFLMTAILSEPSFAVCINILTRDQVSVLPTPPLTVSQGLKKFYFTTPRIFKTNRNAALAVSGY